MTIEVAGPIFLCGIWLQWDGVRIIARIILIPVLQIQQSHLQWQATWQGSFALFVLTGLVLSGTWPLVIGMTASWNPRYSGTVLGVTIAMGALGCVAAPPLMSVLFSTLPAAVVFPVMAIPLLFAAALLVGRGGGSDQ